MFQRNKFMEEDFFIPYRFHLLNKAGLLGNKVWLLWNKAGLLWNKAGLLENTPRVIFITPKVILVTPKETHGARWTKNKEALKYEREMGEEINTSISKCAINKAY